MPRSSPLLRLQELAQEQWGLVTRRQLQAAGMGSTTLERLVAPGGALERVARGVYQIAGAPVPEHRELLAAWLQLAPEIPAWERQPAQGVVSHRSAASVFDLGHLPADHHDFTVARRHQTRRPDVRIHVLPLSDGEWASVRGLPVTRPSRIVADLLRDREDPEGVAQIVTEAIRRINDYPGTFADALGPYAVTFGLRRDDGLAVLRWLLDLAGDPERNRWMAEAREHAERAAARPNIPERTDRE
jgi:predicted transcriptional regulator of viral defense system